VGNKNADRSLPDPWPLRLCYNFPCTVPRRSTVHSRFKLTFFLACASCIVSAQETHNHGIPEKLGKVSFHISCAPAVQTDFNRGIALLHSFAYAPANAAFQKIATQDPQCAMAHWAIAMTLFHPLWDLLPASSVPTATQEIATAQRLGTSDPREQAYIHAYSLLLEHPGTAFTVRNQQYEQAMQALAQQNKSDVEAQVFYALALLSNAPPTDKTHTRQKHALDILEPLDRAYPDHPGITHYIIHASDSSELAQRGLPAARKYARVAPSAPHALHMPSHIFTRLGLWQDSINSNLAAAQAARNQHDTGEELHAMDYLVYAYLQLGRYDGARRILDKLKTMESLGMSDFKVGYAATAMPVRYAVERHRWDEAIKAVPDEKSQPQVAAITAWARALSKARGRLISDVSAELSELQLYESQAAFNGSKDYWAPQIRILREEALAWSLQANRKPQEAESQMRAAADQEDALEKLPVTPGPIVPAREQLGELLLQQHRPADAAREFNASLVTSPNRKNALDGLHATETVRK
jgi:tetratricopeptide (TPR) repeat protein